MKLKIIERDGQFVIRRKKLFSWKDVYFKDSKQTYHASFDSKEIAETALILFQEGESVRPMKIKVVGVMLIIMLLISLVALSYLFNENLTAKCYKETGIKDYRLNGELFCPIPDGNYVAYRFLKDSKPNIAGNNR